MTFVNLNLLVPITDVMPSSIQPYVTGGLTIYSSDLTREYGSYFTSDAEGHLGYNVGGGVDLKLSQLTVSIDMRVRDVQFLGGDVWVFPITLGLRL